jgi:methyl-accepting chemotaxis protein
VSGVSARPARLCSAVFVATAFLVPSSACCSAAARRGPIVAVSDAATRDRRRGPLPRRGAPPARTRSAALAGAFERVRRTTQGRSSTRRRASRAAADAGDLAVRGDAARFGGAFHDVVDGTNRTLDGLQRLTDAARAQRDAAERFLAEVGDVLGRTAAGDLTARVVGEHAASTRRSVPR